MAAKLNPKQIIDLKALAAFGEDGTFWPAKDADKFHKLGLTDVGQAAENGDKPIRINADGIAYLEDLDKKTVDSESDEGQNDDHSGDKAEQKAKGAVAMPKYQIATNVEIPKSSRRTRTSAFPFDKLEVGGSFFVPATEERPDPAKSMASTVNGANARFAEVVEGEVRKNRKGNEVPVTKQTRKFIMRPVDDGAAWGEEFAGVAGAGVWRVAVDTE